jgi:hypothetical protein
MSSATKLKFLIRPAGSLMTYYLEILTFAILLGLSNCYHSLACLFQDSEPCFAFQIMPVLEPSNAHHLFVKFIPSLLATDSYDNQQIQVI